MNSRCQHTPMMSQTMSLSLALSLSHKSNVVQRYDISLSFLTVALCIHTYYYPLAIDHLLACQTGEIRS
jgi:hypothetical protein